MISNVALPTCEIWYVRPSVLMYLLTTVVIFGFYFNKTVVFGEFVQILLQAIPQNSPHQGFALCNV